MMFAVLLVCITMRSEAHAVILAVMFGYVSMCGLFFEGEPVKETDGSVEQDVLDDTLIQQEEKKRGQHGECLHPRKTVRLSNINYLHQNTSL